MHTRVSSGAAAQPFDGGIEAQILFERGEALVKYDDRKVTVSRLREAIDSTGYKPKGAVPEKGSGVGTRERKRRG